MIWILLIITIGMIALSIHFERKRKAKRKKAQLADKRNYSELYKDKGAAQKSQDPKHNKPF